MALDYPQGYTISKLNPSTRGANKRGIASHKPARPHTKLAKKQNPEIRGALPVLKTMTIRFDKP